MLALLGRSQLFFESVKRFLYPVEHRKLATFSPKAWLRRTPINRYNVLVPILRSFVGLHDLLKISHYAAEY